MNMERHIFGTDGVRDIANRGNMTPEFALKLGRAYVKAMKPKRVVIGMDTRQSGGMLQGGLISGIVSEGADVYLCGITPTPGVSYAVRELGADGGAVISASHNPVEYNGIKFLGSDGSKLTDEQELLVEGCISSEPNTSKQIGTIHDAPELVKEYAAHLAQFLDAEAAKPGLVIDCANGAASIPMKYIVSKLEGELISTQTDGKSINASSGVMHMENLTEYVVSHKQRLGFAFDGDADRVLISDSRGRIIDGDIILWVLGRWLKQSRYTGRDKVVATVMSSLSLEEHLRNSDITLYRCPVGDRYVLDEMRNINAALGGEHSGHIIALPYTPTGDGICTAILFLNAIHDMREDVDSLIERFARYPQKLTNLKLSRRLNDEEMRQIGEISSRSNASMRNGRVYIRPSGTEPLLRILVEAREADIVEEVSERLTQELTSYTD